MPRPLVATSAPAGCHRGLRCSHRSRGMIGNDVGVTHTGGAVGSGEAVGYAELVAQLALSFADEREQQRATLVEQIVAGAITAIPGVVAAAVLTMDKAGQLTAPLAAGDQVASWVMAVQNRLGDGPCLDAWRNHKQVAVMDLAADLRWLRFADEVTKMGVLAVVCTPMEVAGRRVGVLTILSSQAHFGDIHEDSEELARVFAAHAGLALTGAAQMTNLTEALSSRDVIGQAKGIVMERFRLTPDAAFAVLVKASTDTNTKLRVLCQNLCETGVLPPPRPARDR